MGVKRGNYRDFARAIPVEIAGVYLAPNVSLSQIYLFRFGATRGINPISQ